MKFPKQIWFVVTIGISAISYPCESKKEALKKYKHIIAMGGNPSIYRGVLQ